MIADLDRHRHVERADPVAGRGKFATARPHGQIAGNQHGIGLLASDAIGKPGERSAVLQPEMQVADVEEPGACGDRGRGEKCERAGLGAIGRARRQFGRFAVEKQADRSAAFGDDRAALGQVDAWAFAKIAAEPCDPVAQDRPRAVGDEPFGEDAVGLWRQVDRLERLVSTADAHAVAVQRRVDGVGDGFGKPAEAERAELLANFGPTPSSARR